MKTIRILMVAVVLLAAHAVGAADANEKAGGVELRATAEVEVPVAADDGTVAVHREPAEKVVPGDEVVYTMHYHNDSDAAAENVVITNPVPSHMLLMRTGGLPPEVALTFSVDGGRTYGALARLTVAGADGRPRPATAADCTHLRWNFTRPLAPGEAGTVDYVAQLQ